MLTCDFLYRRTNHANNSVHIRGRKTTFGMVIKNEMYRGIIQKELLKPDTIAYIQPRVGTNKNMNAPQTPKKPFSAVQPKQTPNPNTGQPKPNAGANPPAPTTDDNGAAYLAYLAGHAAGLADWRQERAQ